jgi:hypothetical protein
MSTIANHIEVKGLERSAADWPTREGRTLICTTFLFRTGLFVGAHVCLVAVLIALG